jgi:methionyl-tRNA formyltransferase
VAALDSVVLLTELQRAGAKRLPLAECLRGMDIRPGMQLSGVDSSAPQAAS